MNKKAAIELSMSTIVILVLAMSMLILGLILVKSIFAGAKYNVDTINDKVKGEIGKLFEEDSKSVIYLPNHEAKISQGTEWGIAFAIRNNVAGTSEAGVFSYEVDVADLSADCRGLTKEKVEKWIKARKTGQDTLSPGETGFFMVRILVPEDAPLCVVPFDVVIKKDNQPYIRDFFDVVVQ